jgi:small subunit ribosomal protein S18
VQGESRALERYHTRDFKAGDIYAPHDLSPAEMKKWGKRQSPHSDAFDALNLSPLDMYKVWLSASPLSSVQMQHIHMTNIR